MLSQKIHGVIKTSINKVTQLSIRTLPMVSNVVRNSENNQENEKYEVTESSRRALKKWRASFRDITGKPLMEVDPDIVFFKWFRTDIELTPSGIDKAFKRWIKKRIVALQTFNQLGYDVMGPDLSAAHFLIFMNGKIKYKGDDKWISLKEVRSKEYMVPNQYNPQYVLIEIDASGCEILYEGLENFKDIPRVRRASFARVPFFNDWYADRISNLFSNVEFLDLSGNPELTERGLEALYRISRLKSLIVTNYHKTAAFELTCMLLEDCIPGLKVTILQPEEMKIEAVKVK